MFKGVIYWFFLIEQLLYIDVVTIKYIIYYLYFINRYFKCKIFTIGV